MNGGASATEADWQQHLALLQNWISARPKSITARVALAAAYIDYAWQARGNGVSPFWLNKFGRMAVVYEDKAAAAKAFARIGENWDESVWGSREQFDAHRAWAGLAPAPRPADKPAFALDPDTTQQLNGLLSAATQASAESRWDDAAKDLRRIITTAKPFPDTDYWLIKAYRMLAVNEQRQSHLAQAQSIMDEEVSLMSHRSGANSTDLATALFGRALLEQQLNDDGRAETDLRRALAIHRKTDSSSVQIPMEAYALAMLYRRHNRYKQAINLLHPLIPPKAIADPHKAANLGWLLEALGMTYQDMGRYQDAEAAYLRMLPILEVTLPVNSLGFVDPLSKMASLYHAMGKETDAQKIEKRLQDLQQSQPQPH